MTVQLFLPTRFLGALSAAMILASCSTVPPQKDAADPGTVDKTVAHYKNPFPQGTYEHFVASKEFPKTYGTYTNEQLLKNPAAGTKRVIICLDEQRGRLYAGNKVVLDFPVSTGVRAYPTYTGSYRVIGKSETHSSNLYGKMYNAEGKCIDYNAESTDAVPEGGRYTGSSMPYWQRLTNAGLGLHVGRVRRTPLSHGCVRLQLDTAKELYKQTKIGTPVIIRQTRESQKNPFAAPPEQKRKPAAAPSVKRPAPKAKPAVKPQVKPEAKQPEPAKATDTAPAPVTPVVPASPISPVSPAAPAAV